MEVVCGRLFPREKRVEKVEEFINLHEGGISVQEYSLNLSSCRSIPLFWHVILEMR